MTTATEFTKHSFDAEARRTCTLIAKFHEQDWGDGLEIFTFYDGSKLIVEADRAEEMEVAA